jgi:hypothetical protein
MKRLYWFGAFGIGSLLVAVVVLGYVVLNIGSESCDERCMQATLPIATNFDIQTDTSDTATAEARTATVEFFTRPLTATAEAIATRDGLGY